MRQTDRGRRRDICSPSHRASTAQAPSSTAEHLRSADGGRGALARRLQRGVQLRLANHQRPATWRGACARARRPGGRRPCRAARAPGQQRAHRGRRCVSRDRAQVARQQAAGLRGGGRQRGAVRAPRRQRAAQQAQAVRLIRRVQRQLVREAAPQRGRHVVRRLCARHQQHTRAARRAAGGNTLRSDHGQPRRGRVARACARHARSPWIAARRGALAGLASLGPLCPGSASPRRLMNRARSDCAKHACWRGPSRSR